MRPAHLRLTHDADQILLNGQLRDELECFDPDALSLIDTSRMTTEKENEFLAAMLAWERAPIVPIGQWFDPPLVAPASLPESDAEVAAQLNSLVRKLHSRGVVLEYTDHLSDRQLLAAIYRDVLTSPEKMIIDRGHKVHWRFVDELSDAETWLRYYASSKERRDWAAASGLPLPPAESTPFPRDLPT